MVFFIFTLQLSLRHQSCCLVTGEGLKALGMAVSNGLEELALINCDVVERDKGLLATLGQLREKELSVPIYVSEMAPYKYSGGLNMCFQLSITIGIFSANLCNYYFSKLLNGEGWRLSLGLGVVPATIFVVGSFCLPDSPNSLVARGHHEAARKELVKIRGTNDVDAEFKEIITASEASDKVKHPWRSLFERHKLPTRFFDKTEFGYIRDSAFEPRRWIAPGQDSIHTAAC
ncbi:sugar carrier protein C-like [Vicia villosa]|uniref:sugar carrier protein C-like n=1 Tax=Vicia villosa TaxID=3911 RepID=UPI00273ADF75|nr:sugar carrier protein C-like [Vicia villosa]